MSINRKWRWHVECFFAENWTRSNGPFLWESYSRMDSPFLSHYKTRSPSKVARFMLWLVCFLLDFKWEEGRGMRESRVIFIDTEWILTFCRVYGAQSGSLFSLSFQQPVVGFLHAASYNSLIWPLITFSFSCTNFGTFYRAGHEICCSFQNAICNFITLFFILAKVRMLCLICFSKLLCDLLKKSRWSNYNVSFPRFIRPSPLSGFNIAPNVRGVYDKNNMGSCLGGSCPRYFFRVIIRERPPKSLSGFERKCQFVF